MVKEKAKTSKEKIVITKDGPYIVSGNLPIAKDIIVSDEEGNSVKWRRETPYAPRDTCALCRCGNSNTKPFCDCTHVKIGFDGTETASKKKYTELAERLEGPDLILTDARELCAGARFCHNKSGRIWDLTEKSDEPNLRKIAMDQAFACPSGRLVVWDKKTGKSIEPELEKSIGLVEDPVQKVSGPLWVKGGIAIESADGKAYEKRNHVTLCRCGKSKNKPFCDCSHIDEGFNDGDESLKG
jgi:CDGSH-type Zn-finger protein